MTDITSRVPRAVCVYCTFYTHIHGNAMWTASYTHVSYKSMFLLLLLLLLSPLLLLLPLLSLYTNVVVSLLSLMMLS